MSNRVFFHVDVNSAFLSWEAAYRIHHGETRDLRKIPSIVGGSQATRHGIVLAKSVPAKKFKIQTGEPVVSALQKCPNLVVVPPRYSIYERCSHDLMDHLRDFSPEVHRFSVDEAFVEYTGLEGLYGEPYKAARDLADAIKNELGFTVNVGVSCNKILAKMAGELEKPDKVHTLWPHEVKDKLWPLPVGELYMVGKRTEKKLTDLGIMTIGDLAQCEPELLVGRLKSMGLMLWHFANGRHIESDKGGAGNFQGMIPNTSSASTTKSIGNSTTVSFDVTDLATAHSVLLSLAETVSSRLRETHLRAHLVYVSYTTNEFLRFSRQHRFPFPTASTIEVYYRAIQIFDELWDGTPIRQMGISTGTFEQHEYLQPSFLDQSWKGELVDHAVDQIRLRYGDSAVMRGRLIKNRVRHMVGGTASNRHFLSEPSSS